MASPAADTAFIRCNDIVTKQWHEVALDPGDLEALREKVDITQVRIAGYANEGGASGTRRPPYVLVRDIRDERLRRYCLVNKLVNIALHHIVLGIDPATARVRFHDGDHLNLRRANLRIPTRMQLLLGRGENIPRLAVKKKAAKGGATEMVTYDESESLPAFISLAREMRECWVIRKAGKEERVILGSREDAMMALAEVAMTGAPTKLK